MLNIDKLNPTDIAHNGSPEYIRALLDDLITIIKRQRKLGDEISGLNLENLERIKGLAANIVSES